MKLIDKAAVVAEIESLLDKGKYHEEYDCAYRDGNNGALYALKGKVNSLEVKEVDLEKELNDYGYHYDYASLASRKELVDFAKHFFELGLTQKGD